LSAYPIEGDIEFQDNRLSAVGEWAHRFSRVLRLKPGAVEKFIDAEETLYTARCIEIKKSAVIFEIIGKKNVPQGLEKDFHLVLLLGIPAASYLKEILAMASELAISEVILFKADHTPVNFSQEEFTSKKNRFESILLEGRIAAEAFLVPRLAFFPSLAQALIFIESDHSPYSLFCGMTPQFPGALNSHDKSLAEYHGKYQEKEKQIMAVGPEGGFSELEIGQLQAKKALPIILGKRVMKTRTAVPALIGALRIYLQNRVGS
jgi:16S rRNA (uracil1498-N3)-methyltransferase